MSINIELRKTASELNAEWRAKVIGTDNAAYGCTVSEALHQLAFMMEYKDVEPDPPKLSLDDELLHCVTRYEELKPVVREKEAIKKLIKPTFEGEPLIQIGHFDITGYWMTRKAYAVPEYTYWMWGIKPNLARLGV